MRVSASFNMFATYCEIILLKIVIYNKRGRNNRYELFCVWKKTTIKLVLTVLSSMDNVCVTPYCLTMPFCLISNTFILRYDFQCIYALYSLSHNFMKTWQLTVTFFLNKIHFVCKTISNLLMLIAKPPN